MVAARGDSKDVFNVGEKWERQCGRRIVFARQDSCNASAARTVKQAADRMLRWNMDNLSGQHHSRTMWV